MKSYPQASYLAESKSATIKLFLRTHTPLLRALLCLPILTVLFLTHPSLTTPTFATNQEKLNILNADLYRMPIPIQLQLVAHTQRYINSIANNVIPNQKSKNVVVRGNEHVARYLVIDTASLTMEALPLEKGKNYKAIITYHEMEYQCRGASKQEALNGTFSHMKTRRLIEILQYRQGRWR